MPVFADLHSHSRFSRATSSDLNLETLERWARTKGINLLGTGDFQHPAWFEEIKRHLKEDGSGVLRSPSGFSWVLQTEISNIYEEGGRIRKIHNLIFAPSLEVAAQINELLSKKGDLRSDGRPILEGYSCPELVEDMKRISADVHIISAHAWTPWFAVFGSKSGFDSLKECFQEKAKHIFAIETGLSSDPAMNWRLSSLDNITPISNSDLHSYWPWRMGREANVFELQELTYKNLFDAIRNKDPSRFLYTIEVDPNYGKYHFDGHRNCGVSMSPKESAATKNRCTNCGRPITIGVLNRIESLADRPEGFVPRGAIPFRSLLPLHEILAGNLRVTLSSQKVWQIYNKLIAAFGNELNILLNAQLDEVAKIADEKIAQLILSNRDGKIKIKPGYDGVYGVPIFDEKAEQVQAREQRSLKQFLAEEEKEVAAAPPA